MKNYLEILNLKKNSMGVFSNLTYSSTDLVSPIEHSTDEVTTLDNNKIAGTAYYFLLSNQIAFECQNDEIWHYYDGEDVVDLQILDSKNNQYNFVLGNSSLIKDAMFQVAIPANSTCIAKPRCQSTPVLLGSTVSSCSINQDKEIQMVNPDQNILNKKDCVYPATLSVPVSLSRATNYISSLTLERHIEGGYFGLYYKSERMVRTHHPRYVKNNSDSNDFNSLMRSSCSSIYFLLENNDFSAWHRLKSDEIWHYYDGTSMVKIHMLDENGKLTTHLLGNPNFDGDARFQVTVKSDTWFAAEVSEKNKFALVGCTVFPGFEYQDFELGERDILIEKFKQSEEIIRKLTRSVNDKQCMKKCENDLSLFSKVDKEVKEHQILNEYKVAYRK